jgi:ATP-dependent helicase HrpA
LSPGELYQDNSARTMGLAISGSPSIPSGVSESLDIHGLSARLAGCMAADARRIHARLRGLERHSAHGEVRGPARAKQLEFIAAEIDRSEALVAARRAAIPAITYPADLPVAARREEIMAAIREHQVVVVCGATGSGKTTQIPKMLLELGRGTRGWIGHTQPRRIAARAVGARIAQELGTRLGERVGFKVRFTDQTSPRSLVKLMTDGILLAETQNDRYLSQYDTIIIDEAHERSLNIDFLLGYLRQLLPRRPDLKVIITSATIDPESFATHFEEGGGRRGEGGRESTQDSQSTGARTPLPRGTVPIIEVSGRTYPVDVRYHPLEAQNPDEEDLNTEQGILRAVDELSQGVEHDPTGGGDILVFLPGEREIRETAEALRKHPLRPAHRVDVVPLYARLSADEQQRIFDPVPGRRRLILATNIAETSLTVPGIRYVIDSGVARISRYSPRIKVQRLPVEKISRASANQRAGRCGRTSPGVCVRLYSEEDFNARPEFTDPEILRTNLASVILRMKALDLGDIEDFPFIQSPGPQAVRDGYDTLLEINALESGGLRMDLTPIGRRLARLPVDPRLGRMLLAADAERCLAEVLVIAAALATQDPRERPIEKQAEADAAHALFREEGSDFLGQLRLWRELHKQQKQLSGGQFRGWCRQHFVSYLRFREWHDVHTQLRELLSEMGFTPEARHAKAEQIHRALLTGLLSSIGRRHKGGGGGGPEASAEPGDYDGARGVRFGIFPGSVLFKKTPTWVMAEEIVKTTRTYARTVASISPAWIEPIAQHLVKRTYADPQWDPQRAEAIVHETQTLYGLEIVARRRVPLAPIDPGAARALFIQHALVGGEYLTNARFFEHNHGLVRRVRHMQEKARTNDLLADQASRFKFFDDRLPPEIVSGVRFEGWRRKAEAREPALLMMRKEDVLASGAVEPLAEQFPDSIAMDDDTHRFPLEDKHDVGSADDGITIIVPEGMVGALTQRRLDWLVPGVVREKAEALMRELPKAMRASLVPIPQTAEAAAMRMRFGHGEFVESLTGALREMTGVFVAREHWHPERLPRHLVMNIRVMDARRPGRVVMSGRDLGKIRREFAGQAEQSVIRLPEGPWNRSGVFVWDFGALPEAVTIEHDARPITIFPALNDEGGAEDVAIRPFASAARALQAHEAGLRRLFYLHTRRECRSLIQTMPGIERLTLLSRSLGAGDGPGGIVESLAELTAHRAWDGAGARGAEVRTREAFETKLNAAWVRIGSSGAEVFSLAEAILRIHAELAPALERAHEEEALAPALLDIRVQMAYLFPDPVRFWTRTPWEWLRQFPRYLAVVQRRLARLHAPDGVARDTRLIHEIEPWLVKLRIRVEQGTPSQRAEAELVLFRWMLEEYRVSLWGANQETIVPVSPKRLEQQWERVVANDQR